MDKLMPEQVEQRAAGLTMGGSFTVLVETDDMGFLSLLTRLAMAGYSTTFEKNEAGQFRVTVMLHPPTA